MCVAVVCAGGVMGFGVVCECVCVGVVCLGAVLCVLVLCV